MGTASREFEWHDPGYDLSQRTATSQTRIVALGFVACWCRVAPMDAEFSSYWPRQPAQVASPDHLLSVADSGASNNVFQSYADNLSKLSFEVGSLLVSHCLRAGGTRAESAITRLSSRHTTMDHVRNAMPDGLPTGV
jgi:hypothetical protein